jgi:glycosyltransferase involved in cell wall biosynthesis
MTKYSVVIPTHGRPESLRRAILSVKNGSYFDVSVIVVCDEAEADTRAVIDTKLGRDDIYLERRGNPGPAASRNLGARCATSEYIIFLDDDDQLSHDYISAANLIIGDRANRLFFSNCIQSVYDSNSDGGVKEFMHKINLGEIEPHNIYVKNFIPNSCLIYPRRLIENRFHDEKLSNLEDWDFILNALQSAPLEYIPADGPIIAKDQSEIKTNRGAQGEKDLPALYIEIYRKWAAPTESIKLDRQKFIQTAIGLVLPLYFL